MDDGDGAEAEKRRLGLVKYDPEKFPTIAALFSAVNCKENELVSTENELVYDITIAGLKKKSAKKKNMGKKADVEVHRVSVAEPTSEKKQLNWNVVIPTENLDIKGLMLQKVILVCLLDDFSEKKATKALGYLLVVTTLDKIDKGKVREHSGDVLFPLSFTCLSFKVFRGEVIEGVVHKILKHRVFLRSGPIENIYLSNQKMTDYQYQIAESLCFLNIKTGSRIEKDVTVRYIVIGVKAVRILRDISTSLVQFPVSVHRCPSNSTFTRLLFYADQTHIKPLIPKQSTKMRKYMDIEEVSRGSHDTPGHWLVTAFIRGNNVLYISTSKSTLAEGA
ncbi:DNA-directed RNA polymerase V subunit 7-like protein [Tanacetum coccineum]